MSTRPVYIYALADPDEPDAIRYIGQTVCPRVRLNFHLTVARNASTATTRVGAWVRQLLGAGKRPVLTVLAEATLETAVQAEEEQIARYAARGLLTNTRRSGRSSAYPVDPALPSEQAPA